MRLFTYLAGDRPVPGRQIGSLGININLAVNRFCRANRSQCRALPGHPVTLLDWLSLGDEALLLVRDATDWMLDNYSNGERMAVHESAVFDLAAAAFFAPIPTPGKVIGVAGNFPAPGSLDKPPHPIIFLKPSGGVTGHLQPVVIPAAAQNVAYEVELAVVIGRKARNLPLEAALSAVGGYTIGNDIGDRVLEKRTSQWTSGKMFDTFTPLGPVLVTPDEVPDPAKLEMSTRLNGETVQQGSTGQMFFGVPELVSRLSGLTTLQPGDVILCGSPKMMGSEPNPAAAVKPGDKIEASIQGLGTLVNPAVAEEEAEA